MFELKAFKKKVRARQMQTRERYSTARRHCVREILAWVFGDGEQPFEYEYDDSDGTRRRVTAWKVLEHRHESFGDVSAWASVDGTFIVHAVLGPFRGTVHGRSAAETMSALTEAAKERLPTVLRDDMREALADTERRIVSAIHGTRLPTPLEEAYASMVEAHETTVYNSDGPWKLRPFSREALEGEPLTVVSAAIKESHLCVTALGVEVQLETVELGEDRWGPFALVRKGRFPLRDGYFLVVDPWPELGEGTGLVLDVEASRDLDVRAWNVFVSPWGQANGGGGRGRWPRYQAESRRVGTHLPRRVMP